MGGNWFWLFVIAAVAWQIIVAIMNERAKKQQEARMREAARRRRESGQGGTPATGQSPFAASTSSTSQMSPTARTESVAQRRQAQLEELRRRRQMQIEELRRREQAAKTPQSTPVQARTPQGSQQSTPARPAPSRQPSPTRGRPAGTKPAARPAPPKAPIEIEGPQHTIVDWSKSGIEHLPKAESVQKPVHTYVTTTKQGRRAADLGLLAGAGLKDPASLRRAIILKEILDPPISLRS